MTTPKPQRRTVRYWLGKPDARTAGEWQSAGRLIEAAGQAAILRGAGQAADESPCDRIGIDFLPIQIQECPGKD
jgi:hypothetical protein